MQRCCYSAIAVAVVLLGVPRAARAEEEEGPRGAHKALQLATAGGLITTAGLGTLVALNQPTLFSEGRCAAGSPILGDYGCRGLSTLHGLSAVLTLVLYTATTTLEFAEFDWPGRNTHGTGYEVLSYVHLIGMGLQPIGGLISAMPEIIGLTRNDSLVRVLRTLHIMTGWLIVGSFVITTAIEL